MSIRGSFSSLKSVLVLMSGSITSQFILIAFSPILTRIFKPEDFAVLALFSALMQIATTVADGRYSLAIFQSREPSDIFKTGLLSVMISAGTSILILVLVIFGHDAAANWWNMPELRIWLWLLPVAVFLGCIMASAQAANVRLGAFKIVASASIIKALAQCGVQVILGLLMVGPGALVIGRTLADGISNGGLVRSVLAATGGWPEWSWNDLIALAGKYRRFPLLSAPAGLINACNFHLMNIALPVLMGPATLGFYSLAMRVLGAPLQQIAIPVGQVFLREAAEELHQTGKAKRSFLKGLIALVGISLVLFGTLSMVIEPLFAFVFGEQWAVAGRYAVILMPLFAVRFIVSPLAGTANLVDIRHSLAINLALIMVSSLVLYFSYIHQWEATKLLRWLALSLSAVYLSYLPVLYWLATSHGNKETEHV